MFRFTRSFITRPQLVASMGFSTVAATSDFKLPALPYADTALEPYISKNTFSYHYGKHHNAYVVNLNNLVNTSFPEYKGKSLEAITQDALKQKRQGVFNNAAQAWNHEFFWHSMTPNGGGVPSADSKLLAQINKDFGSFDVFITKFKDVAKTHFGSGWAWVVYDKTASKLVVKGYHDAETPIQTANEVPILTLDVWEHAYYLDYQNKRPDFIETYCSKLANWNFAESNLKKAL